MAAKTSIPTTEELQQGVLDAREALRLVRIDVAAGTATSVQLAEAESAVRFAETRLEGIEDARQERRRQADRKRAGEIVEELRELDPLIAKQAEREREIRRLCQEYDAAAREIHGEVADAYAELYGIREYSTRHGNKGMLRDEFGVFITSARTAVRVGDRRYNIRGLKGVLEGIVREAATRRGIQASDAKAA